MRLVWATVTRVMLEREGFQRLEVALDGGEMGTCACYPHLSGAAAPGDRAIVNTTAVDLSLGTGGMHYVVARLAPGADGGTGVLLDAVSGGHIMKARYTPLQVDVLAVEAPESPHHDVMQRATSVDGMPVVCCGLHSQVPLVAAALRETRPQARIVYCMTDQAALPLALSDTCAAALDVGLIDATVSCGQAFGGTLEAINLHSGLLAARHVLEADCAIVAIGPGVAGTGTPFGHGGVAQGEAINATVAVGGRAVACLRISQADARDRHRGVSHHSVVALTRVACCAATVAVPTLRGEISDGIESQLSDAGVWDRHVRAVSDHGSVEPPSLMGLSVRTMGRGYEDDPAFFAAAFAAGDIASKLM